MKTITIPRQNLTQYEIMLIMRPDLPEEKFLKFLSEIKEHAKRNLALEFNLSNRGRRKLAYAMRKFQDGIYIQFNFLGSGYILNSLIKRLKLEESILRYIVQKT
uniref:Small ribosomal subunit protein bS6c n=1 Tax=Cyanidium caldarium TaxID=2771 RepID=RR6_CYACA|nr:ribosomal protein S6 [Cyanidium caldarium]O19917.1 RecName: Full=Small ribosomal subunit protein bS6c; AltName: Full=30S ribosomal protein S6, chloroplastic [Cyanidium caldarium]AAB82672.1 unknown [Cyanidium caldarium]WDB00216.1 ribosomal protein S6 [Cyanidium caldarium]